VFSRDFYERFILNTKIEKISRENSETLKFITYFNPLLKKEKSFVHLENTYSDNVLEMHKTIA
jgi:hypothetical protein